MRTWTFSVDGVCGIVTADDVGLAIILVNQQHNIVLRAAELIPVITSTRWSRLLNVK